MHFPEKLTLSLVFEANFEHYLIEEDENLKFSINRMKWFNTIEDLIIVKILN